LVEFWTLTGVERQLSDQRTQRGRLGLAVLLKFFQFEGRFPDYHKAVPLPAVDYVAEQLDVPVRGYPETFFVLLQRDQAASLR